MISGRNGLWRDEEDKEQRGKAKEADSTGRRDAVFNVLCSMFRVPWYRRASL